MQNGEEFKFDKRKTVKWALGAAGVICSAIGIIAAVAIYFVLTPAIDKMDNSIEKGFATADKEMASTQSAAANTSEAVGKLVNTLKQINTLGTAAKAMGLANSISIDTSGFEGAQMNIKNAADGLDDARKSVKEIKTSTEKMFTAIKTAILLLCAALTMISIALGAYSAGLFL